VNAVDDLKTKVNRTTTCLMNNNAVRSPDCNLKVYIHKCLKKNSQHASKLAGGHENVNSFHPSYDCFFYPRTATSGLNYEPSPHILNYLA